MQWDCELSRVCAQRCRNSCLSWKSGTSWSSMDSHFQRGIKSCTPWTGTKVLHNTPFRDTGGHITQALILASASLISRLLDSVLHRSRRIRMKSWGLSPTNESFPASNSVISLLFSVSDTHVQEWQSGVHPGPRECHACHWPTRTGRSCCALGLWGHFGFAEGPGLDQVSCRSYQGVGKLGCGEAQ